MLGWFFRAEPFGLIDLGGIDRMDEAHLQRLATTASRSISDQEQTRSDRIFSCLCIGGVRLSLRK